MPLFRRSDLDRGSGGDRWVLVGLGNPGSDYESTRHNAGAMALQEMASRHHATLKRHKSGCLVAETTLDGSRVVLARPTSYMNESGRPVRALMDWYKAKPENLIVLHDEMDVPFGEVRIKDGGGTAGHNGLGSIVNHLSTKDFLRVRIGVGRPRGRDAVDHVLAGFSAAQRKELPFLVGTAADAAERIVTVGAERAMNEINTRLTEE
ncbi:MAG: aminoacyl-tRNA hydrolase [Actinomycetota bacterium]